MTTGSTHRPAFSLVELLVILAILGVHVGLLLPAVQKLREASNRARCEDNLKQIALACHGYESSHGVLPPGYLGAINPDPAAMPQEVAANGQYVGLMVFLLPYLDQNALAERLKEVGGPYWDLDPAGTNPLPTTPDGTPWFWGPGYPP